MIPTNWVKSKGVYERIGGWIVRMGGDEIHVRNILKINEMTGCHLVFPTRSEPLR